MWLLKLHERNCQLSDNGKQLKVKVIQTIDGRRVERTSNTIVIRVLIPPPPAPAPEPEPALKSVSIINVSSKYTVGDLIEAQAVVEGEVDISKVHFTWTIEGGNKTITGHEQTFSFEADRIYNKKKLILTAEYEGTSRTASKTLKVAPKKVSVVNKKKPNKTLYFVLFIVVFIFILIVVIIGLILRRRREKY